MISVSKKHLEVAQNQVSFLKKKIYATFLLGGIIILATLFLHSYPQYQKAQALKANIVQTEQNIKTQENSLNRKNTELQKISTEYDLELEGSKVILDQVFPFDDPTDKIVQFVEDFALRYDTEENPLVIENISFSAPRAKEGYKILPFRTNVEASEYNFIRFLRQIEKSGSLDPKDFFNSSDPVVAMSIISINVTVPTQDTIDLALQRIQGQQTEKQKFSFNLEMHAYFRDPATEQKL